MIEATAGWSRVQRVALVVGVAALLVCLLAAVLKPGQFFYSYLLGFVFWINVALGSLAILMLHHLSGGGWGLVIRRLLEASVQTLPWMALLFLPLLFGLKELYEWARPEVVAHDEALRHKSPYLNVPFFLARAFLYFAIWIVMAHFLTRWSRQQDGSDDAQALRLAQRMQGVSGPGLVIYGLTVTFASVDWIMSLDAHWLSTIFGVLIMGGQVLSAFSLMIAVLVLLSGRKPLADFITPTHLHDLGKLLLAFVMLWAYFSFSQFLIIWSGNIPEETPWYLKRMHGGYGWVGLAVVLLHFALPFLLLLSRELKMRARWLGAVAAVVFIMRLVDLYWIIAPEAHGAHLVKLLTDLAAPAGIGGVWLAVFLWQLKDRPLIPLRDPYLLEAREHGKAE